MLIVMFPNMSPTISEGMLIHSAAKDMGLGAGVLDLNPPNKVSSIASYFPAVKYMNHS